MSERMMSDAKLLQVLAEMQAGNFTIEQERSEPVFDGSTGQALTVPFQPRIMFADVYATRLAAEMKAVLDELAQLRAKVEAGRRDVVNEVIQQLKDSLKDTSRRRPNPAHGAPKPTNHNPVA